MNYAHLIDEGLTIAIGVWGVLFGYRVLGKRPGLSVKYDEWHARNQGLFKIGGALMIGVGVVRLLLFAPTTPAEAAKSPDSLKWRTVASSDGALAVRMPGEPRIETRNDEGDAGPTKFVKQKVGVADDRIIFGLLELHFLADDVKFDPHLLLNSTAQATLEQSKGELLAEREIRQGEVVGKELTIGMPDDYAVVTQFYPVGRALFQLKTVTPQALVSSPLVKEFFNSVVIRPTGPPESTAETGGPESAGAGSRPAPE